MIAFARENSLGVTQHLRAPGLTFHYKVLKESMKLSACPGCVKPWIKRAHPRGHVCAAQGEGGHGVQVDGDCPTPTITGALTTVPEAAVRQVHPLTVPASKKPPPAGSGVRRELFTNQVAEDDKSWK